jgi:hypothetical protein
MQTTATNASAILAGEQRSARFKYRHSVAGAAREVSIPVTWIWAWLLVKRLKFQTRLRKVWVRLEAVQEVFGNPEADRDAFYATGEFLASTEAIRQISERWPDEPHPYTKFQPSAKKAPQTATAEASNPVLGGEESA